MRLVANKGRNRSSSAATAASTGFAPDLRAWFAKSVSKIVFLILSPISAKKPSIAKKLIGLCVRYNPPITPNTLNGIAMKISNGCKNERNSSTNTRYMMNNRAGKASANVLNESWFCDSWPISKFRSLEVRLYCDSLAAVNSLLTAAFANVTSVVVSLPSKLAETATFTVPFVPLKT